MKYSVTCEHGGTSVSYGKRPKPGHTVFARKTLNESLKRPVSWQDDGVVRSSSAAMNASTSSRWMLRAAVGIPWQARNATKRARPIVGVGADGPRSQVGRLQVETPGRQKCAKLSNAGGVLRSQPRC